MHQKVIKFCFTGRDPCWWQILTALTMIVCVCARTTRELLNLFADLIISASTLTRTDLPAWPTHQQSFVDALYLKLSISTTRRPVQALPSFLASKWHGHNIRWIRKCITCSLDWRSIWQPEKISAIYLAWFHGYIASTYPVHCGDRLACIRRSCNCALHWAIVSASTSCTLVSQVPPALTSRRAPATLIWKTGGKRMEGGVL